MSASHERDPGFFTRTDSGLIISNETMEQVRAERRKVVRWLESDWKKHRRVFQDYIKHKIQLALFCEECKVRIGFVELASNKFALRCNCTDRIVTKGV